MSPRESPRMRDQECHQENHQERDQDQEMTMHPYSSLQLQLQTAALHKTCALTGYSNELKRPLFILICPVTFLARPT
jgi:hypothetical protein